MGMTDHHVISNRSGYLPNIVAVNSAKFITIYREFGRRDLARYSRVGGVRGCFKLYLLAVTRDI